MYCKKCYEFITGDCMLTNDVCVFCYYKIDSWDSNGIPLDKKDAIYDYAGHFKEYQRNLFNTYKRFYKNITKELATIPRGCIVEKTIKGHIYYYKAYREGKKVTFKYVGKTFPEKLSKDSQRRKHLTKKLREVQSTLYMLGIIKRPSSRYNRIKVFERDNYTCQYCGKTVKDNVILHVDHIEPLKKGGKDTMDNYVTACSKCNLSKNDKLLERTW